MKRQIKNLFVLLLAVPLSPIIIAVSPLLIYLLVSCEPSTSLKTCTSPLTHQEAISFLHAGITTYSSGKCDDRNNETCTSLEDIRFTTVILVNKLHYNSSCKQTVITGGTEIGHSIRGTHTHGNGYKVDLRGTPCLSEYIEKNGEEIAPSEDKDYSVRYSLYGEIFQQHDTTKHWDVEVKNCH